jgi:hypothetical protein
MLILLIPSADVRFSILELLELRDNSRTDDSIKMIKKFFLVIKLFFLVLMG